MPLKIYFKEDENIPEEVRKKAIRDVDGAFVTLKTHFDENDCKIVEAMEMGKLNTDNATYVDRFGKTLDILDMSTGSMACMLLNSGHAVDMLECGYNAIETAITYCKNGTMLLSFNCLTYDLERECDVEFDGHLFKTQLALKEYIDYGKL